MMKSGRTLSIVVVCLLTLTAIAQPSRRIKIDFKDIKLKNGLRVLLVEDHSAPVVSVAITFDVGSRNEHKERTGFAHLFEHLMMFTGSQNVGKSEYAMLVGSNGGGANGRATEDCTLYYAVVPSNQLDMILFLEADRMRALDITQENLDTQRNGVQEERRSRLDNQPYGKSDEMLQERMYDNFAYKHSVIGSMEDLNAASLREVRDFFRIYYGPNNASLALVGDFKSDAVLAKIRSAFESIPSQPAPATVERTEPEQNAERRFTVEDPLARLPRIIMGFKGIVVNTPDAFAMQVLNQTLATGQGSRLYQKLVKERELVTEVSGFLNAMRGNGSYKVTVTLAQLKNIEDVEAVISEELSRLQREPIASWELAKAKNSQRRALIQAIQNSLGQAIRLTEFAVFNNEPNLINAQFDKLEAVTKEDVQRVANKYLKTTNRTVGITIPIPKGSSTAASAN